MVTMINQKDYYQQNIVGMEIEFGSTILKGKYNKINLKGMENIGIDDQRWWSLRKKFTLNTIKNSSLGKVLFFTIDKIIGTNREGVTKEIQEKLQKCKYGIQITEFGGDKPGGYLRGYVYIIQSGAVKDQFPNRVGKKLAIEYPFKFFCYKLDEKIGVTVKPYSYIVQLTAKNLKYYTGSLRTKEEADQLNDLALTKYLKNHIYIIWGNNEAEWNENWETTLKTRLFYSEQGDASRNPILNMLGLPYR